MTQEQKMYEMLLECTPSQQDFFKRLYPNMPSKKQIDNAIGQIERTLEKNKIYTKSCKDNNIITSNGYLDYLPYRQIEKKLQAEGFDVLIFIPSIEEDNSKITCGNAILSQR